MSGISRGDMLAWLLLAPALCSRPPCDEALGTQARGVASAPQHPRATGTPHRHPQTVGDFNAQLSLFTAHNPYERLRVDGIPALSDPAIEGDPKHCCGIDQRLLKLLKII